MTDPMGHIHEQARTLDVNLACWNRREDDEDGATARRAGNSAMDAIDCLLRELHEVRAELIAEIRRYDDATAARVDAWLTRGAR